MFCLAVNSDFSTRMVLPICSLKPGQTFFYPYKRIHFSSANIYRDEFIATIPETERHDMLLAYHAQLNSVDDDTRLKAAKAWSKWESVNSTVSDSIGTHLLRTCQDVDVKVACKC
jgi:hypothetical protein